MLINEGRIVLSKGAHENHFRPAIDPLFRSAAVAHDNKVTGIVLSGNLDDDTAGLSAFIKMRGNCVVQDPNDAAYPGMPQNALQHLKVDYCLPLSEMGSLLISLVQKEPGKRAPIPDDIALEARLAQQTSNQQNSIDH